MKKLFLVLALVLTIPFVLLGCDKSADEEGLITVIVLDLEENEEFNGEVGYAKGDTLLSILQAHETIALKGETQSFGFYILEVCGINVGSFTDVYWSIAVDGEYSLVGIGEIELVDGMEVTLSLLPF